MRRDGIKELMKELVKNVFSISWIFCISSHLLSPESCSSSYGKRQFPAGAFAGFFFMVLIADMLPVLGPIIGRHIAGLVAKGGIWNGSKAGFTAGILMPLSGLLLQE